MCHENGGYIVCHNRQEAQRIAKHARDLGLKIPLPLTYEEFIKGAYYGKGVKNVYIDNVEMLIRSMCRDVIPLAATMTEQAI